METTIYVITLNCNNERVNTFATVGNMLAEWYKGGDIPTNDDTVLYCSLGGTRLYFDTFGDLMECLTGDAETKED